MSLFDPTADKFENLLIHLANLQQTVFPIGPPRKNFTALETQSVSFMFKTAEIMGMATLLG